MSAKSAACCICQSMEGANPAGAGDQPDLWGTEQCTLNNYFSCQEGCLSNNSPACSSKNKTGVDKHEGFSAEVLKMTRSTHYKGEDP